MKQEAVTGRCFLAVTCNMIYFSLLCPKKKKKAQVPIQQKEDTPMRTEDKS